MAYAQAVENLVSEITSDFKSGAAFRVGKALQQAQPKHAIKAQAKSGWGGSTGGNGQSSAGGKKSCRGKGKKSLNNAAPFKVDPGKGGRMELAWCFGMVMQGYFFGFREDRIHPEMKPFFRRSYPVESELRGLVDKERNRWVENGFVKE